MKRIFWIIGIYSVLIFAVCLGASFIYRPLPELNIGEEGVYRNLRALFWFFTVFPAALLSGVTIGCSSLWKSDFRNSRKRFSDAMLVRFRTILITSIILVLCIGIVHEVIVPNVKYGIEILEAGPAEFRYATANARELMEQGEIELAYSYAKRAAVVARHDAAAQEYLAKVRNALDLDRDKLHHGLDRDKESGNDVVKNDKLLPLNSKEFSYSVKECLEKSAEAKEKEDWFLAHYWAEIAVNICPGTDTNYMNAKFASGEAWQALQSPEGFGNEDDRLYYNQKKLAYSALNSSEISDKVRAYYMFKGLEKWPDRVRTDPDVEKFMALAQESLEREYFFTDEIENLSQRLTSRNIYFTLEDDNRNLRNVYFIRGVMDTSHDGRSVRYLEDFYEIMFTADGKFVRMMHAPVAKVLSVSKDLFEEGTYEELGMDSKWRSVPFVMLKAVDRETESKEIAPVYSYDESDIPGDVLSHIGFMEDANPRIIENFMNWRGSINKSVYGSDEHKFTKFLHMPFDDFAIINKASDGPDKMNLVSLMAFMGSVTKYGYSYDIFAKNLVGRLLYPLFVLSLLIIAATMGWNYRIEDEGTRFKFIWLFLVPLYGAVMYVVLEICTYLFNIVNFVLIGLTGTWEMFVAFVLYVLVFVLVSFNFLARYE